MRKAVDKPEKPGVVPAFLKSLLNRNGLHSGLSRGFFTVTFFFAFLAVTYVTAGVIFCRFLKINSTIFLVAYSAMIVLLAFRNYIVYFYRLCQYEDPELRTLSTRGRKARGFKYKAPIMRYKKTDSIDEGFKDFFSGVWEVFFDGPVRCVVSFGAILFVISIFMSADGPGSSSGASSDAGKEPRSIRQYKSFEAIKDKPYYQITPEEKANFKDSHGYSVEQLIQIGQDLEE